MELNNNLIGVQGILVKCLNHTGDFTKINYKGGNEHQILYITTELANFLMVKKLLKEKKVSNHAKDLNEILLFMALNTQFKNPLLKLEEFAHLTNIIPQLSKCLLANICFALDLAEPYGFVIETLPLEVTEQLLDQVIDCLRMGKLEDHPRNAFVILKSVVNKLSVIDLSYKTDDQVDDIIAIASIILQNLTNITTDQAEATKTLKIYQHIGFTLLQFFEFLLYIDESKEILNKLIASVVLTTCSIIKCITLNVFCSWAETNHDDQPLQAVIGEKAYLVMEKFQKNKIATELVTMLSPIARKPKTIAERILEADTSAMIKMVNENNEHKKLWFKALLNTPVFSDPEAVKCIERSWQLCDKSSVDRLLNLPLPKLPKERQLIVKCASNLSFEELTRTLTAYFHHTKFNWTEDISDELVLVFNQVKTDMSVNELKQVLLLILQNARMFFQHFYATAFKRSSGLIQIFKMIKYISEVDNIGLEMLMQVLDQNVPSNQNLSNYIQVFDTMIACEYYTWDFMVAHVILPLINKYKNNQSTLEEFKCCLQILKHFQNLRCEIPKEIQLFEYILTCASENRCKSFLEFESLKEETTSCCVDFVLHKCRDFRRIEGIKESFPTIGTNLHDPWSNYYKSLFYSHNEVSFVELVLPQIDLANYKEGEVEENFTRLLKILPRCVSTEWIILLNEITSKFKFFIVLNVLSDIMILICDYAENQLKNQGEKTNEMLIALKFCLQNYGIFLVSSPNSPEEQVLAINSLCRVLRYIPEPLKPTEGMSLINALPEEMLKSVAEDTDFISRIVLINDRQLCKALAQKMLSSAKRSET